MIYSNCERKNFRPSFQKNQNNILNATNRKRGSEGAQFTAL